MNKIGKILLVVVLMSAVITILIIKQKNATRGNEADISTYTANHSALDTSSSPAGSAALPSGSHLPRLVDLGAGKCIPCKMMAPILEELKTEYAGRMDVEFIDVWKNPDAGKKYGIKLIPTQIFYAPDGTEQFRHEGFMGKEDILAKWKELGISFE